MIGTVAARSEADSPKRKLMLEAAANLFIAQGYGAVSMDAVAREAGVSKATLYAHFASKDRLFATIITEACTENFDWQAMLPACGLAPREALLAMGKRMLRFLLTERAMAIHRVVIAESPRFPELGRAFYESGPKTLCRLLADWIAGQCALGTLKAADPQAAADQWKSLVNGDLHLRATLGLPVEEAEIDRTVAEAVETFLAAYGA